MAHFLFFGQAWSLELVAALIADVEKAAVELLARHPVFVIHDGRRARYDIDGDSDLGRTGVTRICGHLADNCRLGALETDTDCSKPFSFSAGLQSSAPPATAIVMAPRKPTHCRCIG